MHAILYLNPERHSMMLYVLDPRLGEGGRESFWESTNPLLSNKAVLMDGGPAWKPEIKLAHEFSLLPHIERYAPNQDVVGSSISSSSSVWGNVTRACSSISDMQNRLFRLGFGPMPNFRRCVHVKCVAFDELVAAQHLTASCSQVWCSAQHIPQRRRQRRRPWHIHARMHCIPRPRGARLLPQASHCC